jgi:hypothetical protein
MPTITMPPITMLPVLILLIELTALTAITGVGKKSVLALIGGIHWILYNP